MYSVSSPCQETRLCQKPQTYQELLQPCQELVNHIQMCARRTHFPNMQLYNLVSSREVNIHTILLICLFKPHTSLQQFVHIPSSSFHNVIIKSSLRVMSLATYIASQFAISSPHQNFARDILLIPIILTILHLVSSYKIVRVSSYHKNADQNNC